MLYKVTGACHSVCVCVCVCGVRGGGVQSSVIRGVREGRGGQGLEGVQLPDSLVDEAQQILSINSRLFRIEQELKM